MNSRTAGAVVFLVSSYFGVALAGCVPVDGGAVELSWTVRTSKGQPARCDRRDEGFNEVLGDVGLCVRPCTVIRDGQCIGDVPPSPDCGGRGVKVRSWPCDRLRGVTRFEITAGRKELWIEVTCPDGTPASVAVPESVVRDVADGEVTQLNAVLITVPADGLACTVR